MTLTGGKNIEKAWLHFISANFENAVIVYDNKNLHITELEDTRPVFILFYLIYILLNELYMIPLTGLTQPHFCACPKPGQRFSISMTWYVLCSMD